MAISDPTMTAAIRHRAGHRQFLSPDFESRNSRPLTYSITKGTISPMMSLPEVK